jgi:hypothetical protein
MANLAMGSREPASRSQQSHSAQCQWAPKPPRASQIRASISFLHARNETSARATARRL